MKFGRFPLRPSLRLIHRRYLNRFDLLFGDEAAGGALNCCASAFLASAGNY
jgi:hypothetical protein